MKEDNRVMKALGLSFGRKMGNSDIMVKQVLKQMKANGAETNFIRVGDLNIQDCTGCIACVRGLMGGGNGKCPVKDDFYIIDEAFMEADVIVICAPVYCLSPSGTFKTVCDRMGPSHDLAFRTNARKQGEQMGRPEKQLVDPRWFKKRVAALITIGGARTKHWTSMGLPSMFEICWNGMQVVDVYNGYSAMDFEHIVLNTKVMDRLTKMGDNLTYAARNEIPEDYWCGDEEGVCPVCHNDLLTILHDKGRVECPICGIEGELKLTDGEIKVEFSDEQKNRSRLRYEGKLEHYIEIRDSTQTMKTDPNLKQILENYKEI